MKRHLWPVLAFLIFASIVPATTAETSEDFYPIRTKMRLTFRYVLGRKIEQKDKLWHLTVVRNSFPESLTYTWTRPQDETEESSGTRILTDLKYSRDFNPLFKDDESKATNNTAPWISQEVLKELRKNGAADNFRVGGAGAINWVAASLKVKEKVVFPLLINGKPAAVHGLKLNKGMIVWDNLNNPLVLEYKPLGIPGITGVTGWKVTEINY
jgi:hypothetical protein